MGVISPLSIKVVKKHPPHFNLVRARQMRNNPTDAERRMWRLLRETFPDGRWRRQVQLRHYIVDFASHRLRTVVEVDGGQHDQEVDAQRTGTIESEGYAVVRFWNNEVLLNGEGCMIRLEQLLQQNHPHPTPTRQQAAKSAYPSPIKGEECK